MADHFRALVLRQADDGISHQFEELRFEDLPKGDVVVSVTHSSLNYKDGLAITGKGKIARSFPMIPGIDFAGVVVSSESDSFSPGDAVLSTGWGASETRFGGYAERARAEAGTLTRIPDGLTAEEAMAIGTAGFTAMLSVMTLEEFGIEPGSGEVVVTGAGGGVGSIAVALLARAGFDVVASSGRPELEDYFHALGAKRRLDRAELSRESRPLESETWAGAVDTVGGATLSTLAAQMKRAGGIAVCGNAGGFELSTTVFPLILRGVALLGIDSNFCPAPRREVAWKRLSGDLDRKLLASMSETIPLADIPEAAARIVRGEIRGRVVVKIEQ